MNMYLSMTLWNARNLAAGLLAVVAGLLPFTVSAGIHDIGGADGSFESGFSGMVIEGDVRLVDGFGSLRPTEGSQAALLTNEPDDGSTPGDADVSLLKIENFTIPAEMAALRLDYDFLSDEPRPSFANDQFTVKLILVSSGGEETLLTVDTFIPSYAAPWTGYTRQTGLRTLVADVSTHAGSTDLFTLELRISDTGDGRGNSAILLDNLQFTTAAEPVASSNVEYIEVAAGDVIHFDGAGSSDADDAIINYSWDFGDGIFGVGLTVAYAYPDDGIYQATLTTTDEAGNSSSDSFTVVVGALNHGPTIISPPNVVAAENVEYRYQIVVDDSELAFGDVMSYSLTAGPAGMTIDAASGLVIWTPTAGDPRKSAVTVGVEDSRGLSDTQSFDVVIGPEVYIVTARDDSMLHYARSNGDGTFSQLQFLSDISHYTRGGSAIADFDHDGDFDLISGHGNDGHRLHLYYYEKDGATFKAPVYLGHVGDSAHTVNSWLMDMAAEDFNNDGEMDFVVTGNGSDSWLFTNQGSLQFGEETHFFSGFEIGNEGWSSGHGTVLMRDDSTANSGNWSMRLDATGDGSGLFGLINPANWYLHNGPTMSFAYRIPPGVPVGLFFYIDDKGWIQIGGTATADPDGYPSNPVVSLVDDDSWHTISIDLPEAIRGYWPDAKGRITTFEWWTNNNGTSGQQFWFDDFKISRRSYISGFDESLLPNTGGNGRGTDAGDVNNDGNMDIARARYSDGFIYLYQGDGDGNFVTSQIADPGGDPYGVVLGDFDNDGFDDLIAVEGGSGNPYFYKSNGDVTFQSGVYVASLDTDNHSAYADYDFNNDGNLDIVAVNYTGNTAWYYPGNGDGTFGVRLSIGNTGSTTLGVAAPAGRVTGQPFALATQSADSINEGESVDFDAAGSYDEGSIVSYDWDFGDGTTDSGVNVTHTFADEGEYTVILTVTDDSGAIDRISQQVTVTGDPPLADTGGSYLFGEEMASNERWIGHFDGSASSDPDSSVVRYEWDFGDGFTDDFGDGNADGWTELSGTWQVDAGAYHQTDTSLDRTFAMGGHLNVDDLRFEADIVLEGGTGEEAILVLMADEDATNRYEVILRGRGLNDVLFYRWINGSSATLVDHNLPFTVGPGLTYKLAVERHGNTYSVYLDDIFLFEYADGTHHQGRVGLATYTTHARFDNVRLTTPGEGVTPTHIYNSPGVYSVSLTVYDEVGQSHTATTTATVAAGDAPTAVITGPAVVDEVQAFNGKWAVGVDLSASSDDHGIAGYEVNWGDGSSIDRFGSMKDDFEDGDYSINPAWTVNGGTWSVVDGQLRQTDAGSGWRWIQDLATTYRDFELEVDFKGLSGADGYMGLVFRNVNSSGSTDSYLMYSLNSWDHWRFYDWKTAKILVDGGTGWDADTWYHLRLRVENGTMQLFVTPEGGVESLQIEAPVARHPSGGIGLLANTQSLIYDNVRVTPLGDTLQPVHRYDSVGFYDITLTVMDHAAQTSSDVHTVSVESNAPPVADAGGPYVLDEFDAWDGKWDFILDATASSDDHFIQRFTIDFGDGHSYDTRWDNGSRGSYFLTGTDLYGYDIPDARLARIVATQNGTQIDIINLDDNSVIASNTLDRYGVWDMSPGDGIYFKVKASKPVVAYLTDFGSHSAFMPTMGRDPVGRKFLFHRDANSGFYVFAYQDALVSFYDSGDVLRAEQRLRAGSYWEPAGLGETVYKVISSGDVAMQTAGGNAYTTVPSETGSAVGRLFYGAIYDYTTASVAVFAHEAADVELFDLDTGESLHTHTLAVGEMWYQAGLGTRRLRVVSSGDVELWAGSTEGSSDITYLGDGVSVTAGREGTEFHLHHLMDGLVIFAPNDGTVIDINSGAMSQTLNKDGYWHLAPADILGGSSGVHHITASKPVVIQTLGRANTFNDMGTWLGGVSSRHRYTAAGTYTVTLTARDNADQIHSATTTVEVQQGTPPVAVLDAPASVNESAASGGGWSVDFDAGASTDDSEIIRYEWDFGDGGTSTEIAPNHVYMAIGTYTVTLTLTDRAGQQTIVTHDVEVQANDGPVADAGGPYEFNETFASHGVWQATLDATGSTDDFGIYDYLWTFDPDVADDFAGTTLDIGKWVASAEGVTQDEKITIVGTGSTWGERYLFSEKTFQHNPGMVLQARVKIVDAGGAEHSMWGFKNGNETFHYAQMPYAIYFHDNTWIYIYEDGNGRGNKIIYSKNVEYDVRITLKERGARYEFKAASATDWTLIYDSSHSYDGSLRVGADVHSTVFELDDVSLQMFREGPVIDVGYSLPQVQDVTLRVRDHALQESYDTTTVTILDDGSPVADMGGPYQAEVGSLITFDGSGSTDGTAIQFYDWTFGDTSGGPDDTGSRTANLPFTGKGARPQHFYQQTGTYDVTLTVTDNVGNSDTATTTVEVVVSDPPTADAGGPYEAGASGPPAYLDGRNSDDDFGIVEYRWDFDANVDRDGDGNFSNDIDAVGARPFHVFAGTGNFLEETFDGTVIRWLAAGATQDDLVTLVGSGGWGAQHLFSHENFPRAEFSFRSHVRPVNLSGGQYMMWGLKNTGTNYSYTQMPHAIYFAAGGLLIYENGANRGLFGSYTPGSWYEVRIDLKADVGATYYYRELGATDWIQLYDSTYDSTGSMKLGATMGGSGTFELDNFTATSLQTSHLVTLTVEDGAGQTATDTTTVTAPGNRPPHVITVPWVAHDPITPHETYNGKQIRLKGIVRDADPVSFQWDFGDGTSSAVMDVTNSYDLSVTHIYPDAPEGTPFVAILKVWDGRGQMGQDTYNVVVKPRNLTTEANVAIDEGLWYLHQRQTRTTTDGYRSGWWATSTSGGYTASAIAPAIQSFEINGHFEYGDQSNNPYVETVDRGLKYLFALLTKYDIATQTYGEPDTNGNGIGLSVNSPQPIYEGGPVMDAIASSRSLLQRTVTGTDDVKRRSYFDVLTDMADQYNWGQTDGSSSGGGWRYSWNGGIDNSAAQWGAIGLQAAQDIFGIPVPLWIKERNDVWLNYSYNGTGFGYNGAGNGRATTPSGMVQLAFDDYEATHYRWATAEDYIGSIWSESDSGSMVYKWSCNVPYIGAETCRDYYAMYAFTKAMRLGNPEPVINLAANGYNWFDDPDDGIARILIDDQLDTGRFQGNYRASWDMRSAWAVIMLSRTLFVQPPVADAGRDRVWAVDLPLTFDGSNSYHLDPFRSLVRYEWDFDGDGVFDSVSSDPTATYTYSSIDYPEASLPQTITATLRVTDNNIPSLKATDTVAITIAIPPHPPVADANGPYTCTAGLPCVLDGSGSFDIDPTDFIARYEWELDVVFPYDFDEASGATPSYVWATPGTYNIGLRVWDNGVLNDLDGDGELDENERLSDQDFTTVTVVANLAPVADANGPYTMNEGDTVNLDGTGSYDPNGDSLTYGWDYNNDGVFDDASGPAPTYTGLDDGIYPVELQVSDGLLNSTSATSVTVNNVAPTADAGTDQTVNEGASVNFTGSFTDPGTADTHTSEWNFGDGTTAGGSVTPSHLYAEDGVYTVTLTVTDDDGGVGTASMTVTVENIAPSVDAGADQTITEGDSASFSGSFTDPGTLDTHTTEWNFGGGTTESGTLNPIHTYAEDGTYTVTLTVTDDEGGIGTDSLTVTVNNAAPIVEAGPDQSGVLGDTINLAPATFTDAGVEDTHTATIDWGDGATDTGTVTQGAGSGSVAGSHAYAADGSYTVTVTVTDDDGLFGSDSFQVILASGNAAPIANAGGPYTINEGQGVTLDGSGSNDPDNGPSPLSYAWDLDGDGQYDDATGVTVTLPIQPDNSSFTVGLQVSDGLLTATDTATVTVNNVAPAVNAGPDQAINEGDTASFSGSFTDPGTVDTHTIEWSFGDGSAPVSGSLTPSHTYGDNGVYTVTLTVTDKDGGMGTDTLTVTVNNVAPAVDAGADQMFNEGDTASFSGSFTDPGSVDTHTIEWNFGDGSAPVSGSLTPSHTYADNGIYTVTLTVTDKDGGIGADTLTVTVNNVAPIVEAGPNLSGTPGDTIALAPATFTDAGVQDTHTATIDWGDGTVEPGTVTQGAGAGSVAGSHAYAADGNYTVTVTVTDDDGASGSDSFQVNLTTANVGPTANAGGPYTINEGQGVTLDGSGSNDPDSGPSPLSYAWDLDGDGQYDDATGVTVTLPIQPDNTSFTVGLEVSDGLLTATDTATVTVNNVAPTANAGPDQAIDEGDTASFSGSFTDPGSVDTHTIEWNFGDGSAQVSGTLTPSHTYPTAGIYTVTLTVTDKDGGVGSDTLTVTVQAGAVQTIFNLSARPKPNEVFLTWAPVAGADSYNIYRSTTPGGPYALIASGHVCDYCAYYNPGLTNGVTYYYVVTSVSGGSESLSSNEAGATPQARSSRSRR